MEKNKNCEQVIEKKSNIQEMFDIANDMRQDLPDVAKYFVRTFSTDAGRKVLAWLCNMTVGRYLSPMAKESELWYLEGQRFLVKYIMNMVDKGK